MNSETIKWSELDAEAKDRLVATKIMGWTGGECDGEIGEQPISPDGWYCQRCGYDGSWGDSSEHEQIPPCYTRNMHLAWDVVIRIQKTQPFSARRLFFAEMQRLATSATSLNETGMLIAWPGVLFWLNPEIICLAALKAIGYEAHK